MTKIADIRAKTDDELTTDILNLRKEQFNLRFQSSTGQLENKARFRAVRRDIARMKNCPQCAQAGPCLTLIKP